MTKLPLAPIKRIAEEGGAQRIGIPASEVIGLAAEEWIKRVAVAAEKYAIHAGRKTVKQEDVVVVVKDLGINVTIPQSSKPKSKAKKPEQKPHSAPAAAVQPQVAPQVPQAVQQPPVVPQQQPVQNNKV
jgi:histone H3/H4